MTESEALAEVESAPADLGLRLRDCATEQLAAAVQHLAATPGEALHEGIHKARKTLRRARAILALAERRLSPSVQALDADIGQLGRGLSALRDAQALVETLERLRASEPALQAMLPAAILAARGRRDALLDRSLIRDPGLQSRRSRVDALRRRLQRLDWTQVRERTVAKALARSLRRVERAHAQARRHPQDDETWHRLRRRLRRLRQQHGVLADLAPQLLADLPERDARAEALGESQDDALLLARCGAHSPFDAAQRAVLRQVARARLARVRA